MLKEDLRRSETMSDPDILAGELVFRGTRVPVKSLFDYLEHGSTVDGFLQEFPGVHREQVVRVLRDAYQAALENANCVG
jgi:uncharacterized protein (DUF433 family)